MKTIQLLENEYQKMVKKYGKDFEKMDLKKNEEKNTREDFR